jgi:hypothetical protein
MRLRGDSGASLFFYMDVRMGQMGVVGEGANPPPRCHFAKRGKWLRIGCGLGQNVRNLGGGAYSNFNYLDHSNPSHNPKVYGSNPAPATKLKED